MPGGIFVRVHALRARGGSLKQAGLSSLGLGGIWLGLSMTAATVSAVQILGRPLAIGSLVIAVAAVIGGVTILRRLNGSSPKLIAVALGIEILAVIVAAGRFVLSSAVTGFGLDVRQALVLGVAPVLASLVGILPAGLGLRELIGAGLGPLVGLTASVSFMIIATDRIIGMLVHGLLALGLVTSRSDATP